jgi:riboflavin synthase
MFTGLIDDIGEIIESNETGAGKTLRIATAYDLSSLKTGSSIACAGVCLTVTEQGNKNDRRWFTVEVSPETLQKTTLGSWKAGRRINLERALKIGDAIGGHFVTGHVDAIVRIISRNSEGDYIRFIFSAPAVLSRFIAKKGSVTLDGVSLTVNGVSDDGFDVMLIPHTLSKTTFAEREEGDMVNIEVDMLARYIARLQGF